MVSLEDLQRFISGVVCAFAAAACAAGDPAEVAVELGEGKGGWRQLEDRATVEVHLGPQGGQHMFAGARISGLWPGERRDGTDDPRVGFRVVDTGGEVWSAALRPLRRPFVPCAAGGFELDGGSTIYMIDGATALDGREVELEVDVEEAFGAVASDTRLVSVRVVIDE